MSENLPARVKFFRDSIQQIIDSRAEPSYDMLRSLLVEDERLAEWERRTGTAPQEAQADPKWEFEGDPPRPPEIAPVPQTEGECPDCEDGTLYDPDALPLAPTVPCPTCSGTGKEGEK